MIYVQNNTEYSIVSFFSACEGEMTFSLILSLSTTFPVLVSALSLISNNMTGFLLKILP